MQCLLEAAEAVRSRALVLADLLDVLQSLGLEDLLVVEEELLAALDSGNSEEEDTESSQDK